MPENQEPYEIESLYTDAFTPLFRYVFIRTHDYDLACDITQQSFLKFLKRKDLPRNLTDGRRLLFVIARNALVDHWRSSSVRTTQLSDDLDREWSQEKSIEESLITQEDIEFIRSLMGKLNETEAEVISLRLANELPYETIGSLLEITSENARQIYSRALKKLKEHVTAAA